MSKSACSDEQRIVLQGEVECPSLSDLPVESLQNYNSLESVAQDCTERKEMPVWLIVVLSFAITLLLIYVLIPRLVMLSIPS